MSGFSNPVANAAGTLIRTVMKSINYVIGVSGWQISKNGDAEFNNGSFRGIIRVVALNGSEIDIDPSNINPQIIFYSPDHTNSAFINAVSAGNPSAADLGINSGQYMAPDGIARGGRLYFNGVGSGVNQFSVIKTTNQSTRGGNFTVTYDKAQMTYDDQDAAISWGLSFLRSGQAAFVVSNDSAAGSGLTVNGMDLGFGGNKRADSIAGTGPIGAETVTLTTPAMTFYDGRAYSVHYAAETSGSVANMSALYRVHRTNIAGATILIATYAMSPTVGNTYRCEGHFYVKNASGANITDTLALTLQGLGGNVSENAGAVFCRYLEVRDVGPQTQYLSAIQI